MSGPLQDTICAIATPVGEGGIGILRLSGEKAIEVAAGLVWLRSGKPLASARSHRLYHADILEGAAGRSPGGQPHPSRPIDEGLVVVMRAPHSYTAENIVELHCHGGPFVLQAVCEAMVRAGARMAEPGEFTKRAFLNGRLDLAQAEAVLDTIRSKTAGSLRLAQEQLRGGLSQEVNRLRDTLIRLLAHVEAAIDFTEEDIAFIQPQELADGIQRTMAEIARLAETCREGRILREGATAAIIGHPNVGKSSLLNALLMADRAIVTPIPGTTRDVIEELVNIRGVPVRLLDTAGLRQADDPVEQEGVRRSQAAMERAEVLLIVLDGSLPLSEADRRLFARHPDKKRLVAINKCDLPSRMTQSELAELTALAGAPEPERAETVPIIHVSAKTGEGLDRLRDAIRMRLLRVNFEPGEAALVSSVRHQAALLKAKDALGATASSVERALSGEFVAVDLRAAINALGEITGAVSTDDILDRIFRDFCIGK
ncbi:MAG: tRNA uridine-5-carboxymethylaminomethyl(34) synthesis GTPase MnmE [Nitrospirae bacterium]|nr:tRNA uridine-5-carboxymethylaminomethyl(34) synthesis GTPase MnmE [Nitrospirota bacterium]